MGIISNLGFGIPVITGQFMTVSLQAFWTHVSLKHPLAMHLCRQAAAQLDDCSYRGLQAQNLSPNAHAGAVLLAAFSWHPNELTSYQTWLRARLETACTIPIPLAAACARAPGAGYRLACVSYVPAPQFYLAAHAGHWQHLEIWPGGRAGLLCHRAAVPAQLGKR